jgi:hypothetical protein
LEKWFRLYGLFPDLGAGRNISTSKMAFIGRVRKAA